MADVRRLFSVSTPDWGETHLSPEAVAAYVDDELTPGARERAARHLSRCPECTSEIVTQGQARSALRSADTPSLPSSLLSSLRAIPQQTELPGPPPGLAVTDDGQLVALLRPEPGRGSAGSNRRGRRGMSRRARLGAGAAVSGLALGALAFGGSLTSGSPVQLEGNLLGGPVQMGGSAADARLSVARPPAPERAPGLPVLDAALRQRLDTMPVVFGPGGP
ncbi:MAG TPA: zf-HC2 domain-containing protein [Pseudonocardia sp.]|nr:zf-HC2 domain-containing protein [Pseudonocardia sp.]